MIRFGLNIACCIGFAHAAFADLLDSEQLAAMQAADVGLLGEYHDNPDHHAGQAALLAAVAPKAVVFEMLTPAMAAQVNSDDSDDRAQLEDLGTRIGWEAAGWPDFALYLPVFEALGDAMVVGAAAPRREVRAAFEQGAAAIFGPDAAAFGLTTPLDAVEQEAREALQFSAHCEAMPRNLMSGMVEAQRFRDAQFARATLQALREAGAPVVVIAGNGHVRKDWGVPAALRRAAPEEIIFSVGFGEGAVAIDDKRYDAHVVTPDIPRDDPCAGFKG